MLPPPSSDLRRFASLLALGLCLASCAASPAQDSPTPPPAAAEPNGGNGNGQTDAGGDFSAPTAASRRAAVEGLLTPRPKSIPSASALTSAQGTQFARALALAEKGKFDAALDEARKIKDPVATRLMDWIVLKDPGAEAEWPRYRAFLDTAKDWPRLTSIRARAEAVMPDQLPPKDIFAYFGAYAPVTALGEVRLARALLETGQEAKAIETLRRMWVTRDLTVGLEEAVMTKYGRYFRPEDHALRLDRLIWDEEPQAAQRMLPRVNAEWQAIARARLALQAQAGNVDTLLAKVPAAQQAQAGLLYERVRWRRRKEDDLGALELLKAAPPAVFRVRPDKWWTERAVAARRLLQSGDAKGAYGLIASHGLTSGTNFATAEFTAGWIALRFTGDYGAAEKHFRALYDGTATPQSRSRAAFWLARAYAAMGREGEARTWYTTAAGHPTTFFGQLAREVALPDKRLPLETDVAINATQRDAFLRAELVRAFDLLELADAEELSRTFLSRLIEMAETPVEMHLIAELSDSLGRPNIAVQLARQAGNRGFPLIRHGYPVIELPRRDGASSTETALALAIARQESNFDPKAKSTAGALGLMQLMPATAKQTAKELKLKYDIKKLTADPRFNLILGQHYLGERIDQFGGSYIMAIAAYNAGAGRVQQWVAAYGDPRTGAIDPIDWIELIPFSETRNYVQRVIENLQVYRSVMSKGSTPVQVGTDINRGGKQAPCPVAAISGADAKCLAVRPGAPG